MLKTISYNIQQSGAQALYGPKQSHWLLCLCVCFICLIFELFSVQTEAMLRYQSNLLSTKEYWRLISAHFVHLGWPHFFLNMLGFLVVWYIYGGIFKVGQWVFIIISSCTGISLCFLIFDPGLVWYVGLSGILHSLLAAALFYLLSNHFVCKKIQLQWEDVVLASGLMIKLVYEQIIGAVPLTESGSGGPVIVNAHFYGAIFGCICVLFLFKFTKFKVT